MKTLTKREIVESLLAGHKNSLIQGELMERYYQRQIIGNVSHSNLYNQMLGKVQAEIQELKRLIEFFGSLDVEN